MPDDLIDDNLIAEFLTECEDHLNGIETDLLTLESQCAAGGATEKELVNRIFRAAHSIKGGAGFLGLGAIRELAHRTEGVLDRIRNGELLPDGPMISALLEAFDHLRFLLANHQSSEATNLEGILNLLARVGHGQDLGSPEELHQPIEVTWPGISILFSLERGDFRQAVSAGRTLFWIEFDLMRDIQGHGLNPLDMLKRLGTYGRILDSHLDMMNAGDLFSDDNPMRLHWHVLFSTALGPELIGGLVDIPSDQVHVIDTKSLLAETPAPPPAIREPFVRNAPVPQPIEQAAVDAGEPVEQKASKTDSGKTDAGKTDAGKMLRVPTAVIDSLMDLAGELVLSRNQLLAAIEKQDLNAIQQGAQKLNGITGELQEIAMLTRMQPIGTLLQKFPRMVRDLAKNLGKDIELSIIGEETEIDKQILEGLGDPLTHMVRNSIDHGIESPEERRKAGKSHRGKVALKAYHLAGQVVLDIVDDGKGIDGDRVAASAVRKGLIPEARVHQMSAAEKQALIFLPGLSTAAAVTDVSGRGVGMDVVKTNIDRLGGEVSIHSEVGQGTTIRIQLPLTLVIVPCLMTATGGERFAIPQTAIGEVIRLTPTQAASRIHCVHHQEVLELRDRLLPVLRLDRFLGLDPVDGTGAGSPASALHLVVLESTRFSYALVVDSFQNSSDIVVKSLAQRLSGLSEYMGAAILGDGRVTLVLDPIGLATRAGLKPVSAEDASRREEKETTVESESISFLLFDHSPTERCAVPLHRVERVDMVNPEELEMVCGKRTLNRRGKNLPLVSLDEVSGLSPFTADRRMVVIVFACDGRETGLLGYPPFDTESAAVELDDQTHRRRGIAGSTILRGRTTLLVSLEELGLAAEPMSASSSPAMLETSAPGSRSNPDSPLILLAEDSDFFRNQLVRILEGASFRVAPVADGREALDYLSSHEGVDLVATDVEMPRLDGLALTREIRRHPQWAQLPVVALTSLAGEDDVARGIAAGVDEYHVKLDHTELLDAVHRLLAGVRAGKN